MDIDYHENLSMYLAEFTIYLDQRYLVNVSIAIIVLFIFWYKSPNFSIIIKDSMPICKKGESLGPYILLLIFPTGGFESFGPQGSFEPYSEVPWPTLSLFEISLFVGFVLLCTRFF